VVKRHFGDEDDQIILYTTMAAVLRAQLLDHGDKSIACLDYDHLLLSSSESNNNSNRKNQNDDLQRFLRLFGISPAAFRNVYRPPVPATELQDHHFNVSPYLQIYMDTLVATSRTTWDTCTAATSSSSSSSSAVHLPY
jgi:hypothetical protein